MGTPRNSRSATDWEALASRWVKHLGGFKTARTARDAIQQGNHLLLLKEATPHGMWRDRCNALGLGASVSTRLMAAARRFSDMPAALFEAVGSATKLIELLPLDDEDVRKLAQGETVHALTLAEIDLMTVKELRVEVRRVVVASEPPEDALMEKRARATAVQSPMRSKPVRLSVEEERILRLFRQCNGPAREALVSVAGLLARP